MSAANLVNTDSVSIANELKRLSRVVSDLETTFRRQRELLKQKGMSLPPGTLQGIQEVYSELDALSKIVEDEQGELGQLRALRQTAELINSTLNLDEVLADVMSEAIRLTRAERGYLVLRDKVTGELTYRVARQITGNLSESEFTVSRSIVQEVARSGNPVLTNDAQNDQGPWTGTDSIYGLQLRSILCVPLLLRGEVTGVIYAENKSFKGVFGDSALQLLYAFANQAAIAIENALLFESARARLAEATAIKELMDSVFASIGSGVIATDPANIITTFNDAAERILVVPHGQANGQPLWNVLPAVEGFEAAVSRIQSMAQPQPEILEANPTLPGQSTPSILSLKLSPMRNTAQVTQGVAIVVDDLTETRHREEQLKAIRRYLTPAMVDNIQSIDQLGLGGERREVTAVFVDVRDIGTFPAQNPRDFMQMLNDYLTVAVNAINSYGGIIDKYMANEIMVLFNTQLNPSEDDHALKAIKAALQMADDYVTRFYPKKNEKPGTCYYRVGIHTGIATLGNTGSETRKEFTAIGDTINLAHRLLENAQPGQIIISRETYQACQESLATMPYIIVTERGEIPVKGLKRLVDIYEVARSAPGQA